MQKEDADMKPIGRREFIQGGALAGGVLAAGGALLTSRVAFAATGGDARLVVVILRGALDGLSAVPPYGDADYGRLRGELALAPPGSSDGALRLDGTFALHPSLPFLHDAYGAGELVVFHAVASPYRERSHFDGQDVLENGTVRPHALQSGWLNRALEALPEAARRERKELGVALGQNVPLVMRGQAQVASWSPSRLASLDEDTLQRITDLYAADPLLSQRLADALAADQIASGDGMDAKAMGGQAGGAGRYTELIRATAGFLRSDSGPRVAVFDTIGWDTHANEGGARGRLAAQLTALDTGIKTLRDELGPAWQKTAVIAVTEFGRTAAINGTRGTDHGTATAAFLVGGAVRGGRVVADWPGLSNRALYEQRDVAPTLDVRAIFKGALQEHLGVPVRALDAQVFPDSGGVKPVKDLFRA